MNPPPGARPVSDTMDFDANASRQAEVMYLTPGLDRGQAADDRSLEAYTRSARSGRGFRPRPVRR